MNMKLLIRVLGVAVVVLFVTGQAGCAKSAESGPISQPVSRDTSDQATKSDSQERPPRSFTVQWVNPRVRELPGVEHRTFHSNAMNCEVGYYVYTPPDYATSDKRYPVIYWLHGAASGGEAVGVGHSTILHKAILEKKIEPMIMVFPNGGRGTFYYDSFDGSIMAETAIIQELIPLIDKNYRTIADRRARAIEGFSMGGFGALKLAFEYPQLFCSLVSGAPALLDWEAMSKSERHGGPVRAERMWNNDQAFFESDHPSTLARKNADTIRQELRIRIVVGDEDTLKERFIDAFHEQLEELNLPHDYELLKGIGHSRIRVYPLVGLKNFQFHETSFAEARE